jgi:hypothetical protein
VSDQFQRILGVSAGADAHRLLALRPGQRQPRAVLAALQSQLTRVDNHPDGQTPEAEVVRQRLYEAARVLLETADGAEISPQSPAGIPAATRASSSPQWMHAPSAVASAPPGAARAEPQRPNLETAPPPALPRASILAAPPNRLDLTAFDRHVLAILVACGGWNAHSRAKLVELAAEHRVSPQGLLKVVTGLCGHARLGAARFDVAQITQGERRFQQLPPAPSLLPGQLTSEDVAESMLPELKEGGAWATIKLSLLFGAVTVLAGFLLLRVLLQDGDGSRAAANPPPVVDHQPGDLFPRDNALPEQPVHSRPALAQWPQPPTFRGSGPPDAAADAVDQSPRLPELIDELARKLSIADTPSAMSRQDWRVFNEQSALIWVEGDRAIVRAVRANIFDVLFALADRSVMAEEFLAELGSPGTAAIDDVLDVWRGAWAAGMLGEISNRADLPAFLRQAADLELRNALGEVAADVRTFNAAAREWLIQKTSRLVELAQSSPEAENFWELWLRAHDSLGRDEGFDRAIAAAIAQILRTSVDLAQPGMLVNILGRLVEEANFAGSHTLREEILAIYSDGAIDNRDLWVFTSLLIEKNAAPWIDEALLVMADATAESRRGAMIELERRWPRAAPAQDSAAAGRGIAVDRALGARWMALARKHVAELSRISQFVDDREQRLLALGLIAAWLNEAAIALAQGDTVSAEQALRSVESGWSSTIPEQAEQHQLQPMQPGGPIQRPGGTNQPTLPTIPGTPGNVPPDAPRPSAPGLPLDPGGMPQNPPTPGGGAPAGRANGPDGTWAAAYNAAERNVDERMELLRSLRATSGGDLGPIDARRIVEEAYRGPIPELRLFAQTILTELFTRGPNVARELVDQFTDAPAREITATFLSSFLSRTMPSPQSSAWRQEARLALLEHALRLMPFAALEIDQLADALAESYADGARMLRPESAGGQSWSQPAEAIAAQEAEWRALAEKRMVSDPVPDSLPAIERRHSTRLALAQGPIERAVAAQITILEMLTYISVGEQPVHAGEARSLLERAAAERIESSHILEQLLRTELAITQVWMLRLEVGEIEADEIDDGADAVGTLSPLPSREGSGVRGIVVDLASLTRALIPPIHHAITPSLHHLQSAPPDWTSRLEALSPDNPLAYFELGEEVMDAAIADEDRALARQLFRLAGALDPGGLGRSSALALALLEEDPQEKRRLLALAALLDRSGESGGGAVGQPNWGPAPLGGGRDVDLGGASALSDSFSYYRRGLGNRATDALDQNPAAAELLARYGDIIGGEARYRENARRYRTGESPINDWDDLITMLRLEAALLAGDERSWSAELLLNGGPPLVEIDPADIAGALRVNPTRALYRNGRWVASED